jgi:Cu+-exporting ATPase
MKKQPCFHCGLVCKNDQYKLDEKLFCCNGCKTVFEILNQSELGCYYDFEKNPGTIPTEINQKYNYLENQEIAEKILEFNDEETSVVNFLVPSIHCSSCIWVLENLHKLHSGIVTSSVNFPKKIIRITFKNTKISLKEVVELLTSIAYEPYISLDDVENNKKGSNKKLIYQLAIAGFSFGNVMLLSFPEYFQEDGFWLEKYKHLFRYLMLLFSIPVVFYSASDYYTSAIKGLKNKIVNIDVPLTLGIFVLFIRSTIEVLFNLGSGFFDSLTGLVFFLLLGKIFQQKTYNFLSFERDYKSYFPIAVTKIFNNKEEIVEVNKVKKGDRILIRNQELIPVDGILINGKASIDYSFVTGESLPVSKTSGDKIFAGGKQLAGAIEVDVLNAIEQSYLTQLWSNKAFAKKDEITIKSTTDKISKYFTFIILTVALIAGIFWSFNSISKAINIASAVLIIACPCGLALSGPFAFGNMLRIFGYRKFYLKDANSIEFAAKIDTIIFDKTGTITTNESSNIIYEGITLSNKELSLVKNSIRNSNHPLNRMLYNFLPEFKTLKVEYFKEFVGKGIVANINKMDIKLGSAIFLKTKKSDKVETTIYVSINDKLKGKFIFKNKYRTNLKVFFKQLKQDYKLVVLSGDNDGEKETLSKIVPDGTTILFNQKPEDKLNYIKKIQEQGAKVMMVGDGLNDAGALAQSNFGISVSEDTNVFSPASNAILDATNFEKLPKYLQLTKKTIRIIKASFILSLIYNTIGMFFAITGQLSPLVAAILMPLSSISVVVFVTLMTNFVARKSM